MPITKSAKKALRQSTSRRERNQKKKNALRLAVKSYAGLIGDKKKDEAREQLRKTFAVIDKTAKSGVIKRNKASRLKSRLAKQLSE